MNRNELHNLCSRHQDEPMVLDDNDANICNDNRQQNTFDHGILTFFMKSTNE